MTMGIFISADDYRPARLAPRLCTDQAICMVTIRRPLGPGATELPTPKQQAGLPWFSTGNILAGNGSNSGPTNSILGSGAHLCGNIQLRVAYISSCYQWAAVAPNEEWSSSFLGLCPVSVVNVTAHSRRLLVSSSEMFTTGPHLKAIVLDYSNNTQLHTTFIIPKGFTSRQVSITGFETTVIRAFHRDAQLLEQYKNTL